MRYHAVEFEFGPETLSRLGDDLLRRWQETIDDAQDTLSKAVSSTNPVDAWSLQLEFGMRNAQRWLAWSDCEAIASDFKSSDEAGADPAAGSSHKASEPAHEQPVPEQPGPEAAATPPAPAEDMPVDIPQAEAAQPADAFAEPVAEANPEPKAEADELQRIRGIGPAIAAKLHARGISSFAQMAALDEAAVAELDSALDLKGRIERDDWIGQAKALAAKS